MHRFRNILHPTDFSEASRPALQVARSLARDYGARLTIVHAVPLSLYVAPYGLPPHLPEAEEARARGLLEQLAAQCAGIETEARLLEEEAVPGILRTARELPADLIVMGTHGATGLTRLLAGSVAESVLRAAPCPVLTLRMPEGATREIAELPAEGRLAAGRAG